MKYPSDKKFDRRLKLTASEIREIRKKRKAGASKNSLAKEYGVDNNTISYHTDPVYRAKHVANAKKWNKGQWEHNPSYKAKNRAKKRDQYNYRIKNDPAFKAYKQEQNLKAAAKRKSTTKNKGI